MAIDLESYQRLKRRADERRSVVDKAAGVLSEQMRAIQSEFEVESIEAAEALLVTLEKEEAAAEAEYVSALADYEEKWKGKL